MQNCLDGAPFNDVNYWALDIDCFNPKMTEKFPEHKFYLTATLIALTEGWLYIHTYSSKK